MLKLHELTKSSRWIADLVYLYFGKISGILVAFVFLPLYSNLLGTSQFGWVAIVISLQTLLMMLDLGVSTIVLRKVASKESLGDGVPRLLKSAELLMILFYLAIAFFIFLVKELGTLELVSLTSLILVTGLLFLIVMQNVYYVALIAAGEFKATTGLQVLWTILRACVSWLILKYAHADFFHFILAQVFVAFFHFLYFRRLAFRYFGSTGEMLRQSVRLSLIGAKSIFSQGKILLVSGIAGAFAMQLDKPIISLFNSPAVLAPYFLAVTISSLPVNLMAGPLVQYFQPKIIKSLASGLREDLKREIRQFSFLIVLFSVCPAFILLAFNIDIIEFWLHGQVIATKVSHYSQILLFGYTISAIGYIPYVLLIAEGHYKFQAKVSVITTIALLCLVAIFSFFGSVDAICYAYSGYFIIITIIFFYKVRWIFLAKVKK